MHNTADSKNDIRIRETRQAIRRALKNFLFGDTSEFLHEQQKRPRSEKSREEK